MQYINLSDISGMIPGPFLIEALDDAGVGAADPAVVTQVLTDACQEVDGRIGGRYTTPLQMPFPTLAVYAAKLYAVRALYKRRAKADGNPYKDDADKMDATLAEVAAGTRPLDPRVNRANPSASAITQPSRTAPAGVTNS